MSSIYSTIEQFTDALQKNVPITCNKRGEWKPQAFLGRVFKWIRYSEEKRCLNIGKAFCKALDHLESIPVVFNSSCITIQDQRRKVASWIKAANQVQVLLQDIESTQTKPLLTQLALRICALKYRFEGIHGGLNRRFDAPLFEKMTTIVGKWKLRHPLMVERTLSDRDIDKIIDTCTYPEFANLLLLDKDLQDLFFSWCIRENNGVREFVEFPAMIARIKQSFLSSRISRCGGDVFRIEKQPTRDFPEVMEKVVTLPFFIERRVEHISILDLDRQVDLGMGMRLTMKKIFEIFSQKKQFPGEVEFFKTTGITLWNTYKMGYWNALENSYVLIDLSRDDWWNQLPVFEELSKEEVELRYRTNLAPGEWLAIAKGMRESQELDFDGQHGHIEMLIPTEAGKYRLFPFGKFPEVYPADFINRLLYLVKTSVAVIAYPDENSIYTHRQAATYLEKKTSEEGKSIMSSIKRDLQKARDQHLIIQFGYENCAQWAQSIFYANCREGKRNLYLMPMLNSEPSNPILRKIFELFRIAPKSWQPYLLAGLDRVLGSAKGLTILEDGKPVFKSMRLHPYRNQQLIFHPGLLHRQIETGAIPGFLSFAQL